MVTMLVYNDGLVGDWTLYSCKNFPFVQDVCIATEHVVENCIYNQYIAAC